MCDASCGARCYGTARTITKTTLTDKVQSSVVLERAVLRCLNETVANIMVLTAWKAKQTMNPLRKCLFPERSISRIMRSVNSTCASQPVPGYPVLATNLIAKAWNSVPDLSASASLVEAKRKIRKWVKTLPQ